MRAYPSFLLFVFPLFSKDSRASVGPGRDKNPCYFSFFFAFQPKNKDLAWLKGAFAKGRFLASDVLREEAPFCAVKILRWICNISNTRIAHADS